MSITLANNIFKPFSDSLNKLKSANTDLFNKLKNNETAVNPMFSNVASIDKYINTLKQSTDAQRQKEKAVTTKVYDDQINNAREVYSDAINKTDGEYVDLERQNSIQKLINERAIAERMENMGLTDSGLNRTQQTAAQLSYSNMQGKIAQQKQAAIDNLNSQMNAKILELKSNKSAALAGIDSEYEKQINSNAVTARNADLDNYTKLVKEQNDATNKRKSEILEAKKYVLNYGFDKEQAVQDVNNLYDLSDDELIEILSTANLTMEEFESWWRKNTAEGKAMAAAEKESQEKTTSYFTDDPLSFMNYAFNIIKNRKSKQNSTGE